MTAQLPAEFADFVLSQETLAPYTRLKIGGPAELLAIPRSRDELSAVVGYSRHQNLPLRVLGTGSNILVSDEGVKGIIIRLTGQAFTSVVVESKTVRAGAGAALSALISQAARSALGGLELLIGIPGTVGGAVRCNAGDRSGEIGQFVRRIEVVEGSGDVQVREQDELRFAYRWSNIEEPVLLSAEFELEADRPEAIVKRMRKAWIQRKAAQPLSFQAAVRLFKDPRGHSAAALIEQAGLAGTRVGGAELSERDANAVVADTGATARDVLRLIELMKSRVRERFGVDLELQITVW
jgi:UDP-N-acetylmuramate dehydrogenase